MSADVDIKLVDPWDQIPNGEAVPLRFTVTCPLESAAAIEITAGGVTHPTAFVNTDLLLQDFTLHPGDTTSITVWVRFDATGPANLSAFELKYRTVVSLSRRLLANLPAHPFRVVPSLGKSLAMELTRVCGYDDAVKVEVVAKNVSQADICDFELTISPPNVVRSGPLRRRETVLRPGQEIRFDLVVTSPEVDFAFVASIAGERVESTRTFRIPTTEQANPDIPPPFEFLEPRALTNDRVTIVPEKQSLEIVANNGVFPVQGGKSRYVLTVFPSNPLASSVRLYSAAGQVEVEPFAKPGREWPYLITIVDNPTLTQLIRLDYDVQVQGTPLRGEIYLSIRPTWHKTWGLAATAGIALTIKGATALGAAIARSDGGFDDMLIDWHELFQKRWWEWFQLISIPFIRGGLWLIDRIWRPFQES